MSFYLNDFKAHLENLAKSVEVTDHTDPRQFKFQHQKNVSLEESYKTMQESRTPSNVIRQIRSH